MRILSFIIFNSLFIYAQGQSLEISGARNVNNYFIYSNEQGTFQTQFESDDGYSMSLAMDHIFSDSSLFMLSIDFINYGGSIYTANVGNLGGGSNTEATVNSNVVGFGIYPINFSSKNKILHLNIGGEFNFLLNNTTVGQQYSWEYGTQSKTVALSDGSINNKFIYGIVTRAALEFPVAKNWSITPQFLLYLGLSSEFKNIETDVYSFRASFGIGIKKNLGKG